MKSKKIEIISDDIFLIKAISSLVSCKELDSLNRSLLIIDIDRLSNLTSLTNYVRHASPTAVISGISRNGMMSRVLDKLPTFSIDAPFPLSAVEPGCGLRLSSSSVEAAIQLAFSPVHQDHVTMSRRFWLAQCQGVMTGSNLSQIQNHVLYHFRRHSDLQTVSKLTGIKPKTCYSHVRSLIRNLNLRNITELRYFSTQL